MTLQRLEAFNKVWKHCPPPHVSLGRISSMLMQYFGVTEAKPALSTNPDFINLPEYED